MSASLITASLTIVIMSLSSWSCSSSPARFSPLPRNQPMTTTSTESPASFVLDDPSNSATTIENSDQLMSEEICHRCYDKIQYATDNLDMYENIVAKQKKLIKRRKAQVEAAISTDRPASRVHKLTRSSPASASTEINSQNSTVRSRTLPADYILVSRLRVARSPAQTDQTRPLNSDKYGTNKKDAELARLKRDQQQQKDKTCKSLLEVRDCLEALTDQCIGNLQFHSYEVWAEQYYGRLRCPYPNNPNIKPFDLRSTVQLEDEIKSPVARPISSPAAVQERMHKILPGRQFPRPLGVMLKPQEGSSLVTMQRFQGPDQQQQVVTPLDQQTKGLQPSLVSSYRKFSHQQKSDVDYESLNMINVGRILLVPCCFAIMVALLALASLHYKRPKEDDNQEQEVDAGPMFKF